MKHRLKPINSADRLYLSAVIAGLVFLVFAFGRQKGWW